MLGVKLNKYNLFGFMGCSGLGKILSPSFSTGYYHSGEGKRLMYMNPGADLKLFFSDGERYCFYRLTLSYQRHLIVKSGEKAYSLFSVSLGIGLNVAKNKPVKDDLISSGFNF